MVPSIIRESNAAKGAGPNGRGVRPAESPRRVLVVDDESAIVDILVEGARAAGIAAFGTTDPLEMLAACERDLVDTVVLDLRMPRIDGIELLHAIAQTPARPRVLLMSGVDSAVLETARSYVEALGLESLGFVEKPFRIASVVEVLLRARPDRNDPSVERPLAPVGAPLGDSFADSIEMFVQPQVSLVDHRVVSFEALARMRLADGSIVAPGRFLEDVRRSCGLRTLTDVMLDHALVALASLRRDGWLHSASVNVPADVLAEPGFVEHVFARLDAHRLPAWALTLEITEDQIVRRDGPTLGALARLRLAGVGLAIDDFGTGSSTFTQTRAVPATEIKLDRSLVAGLDGSERGRVIVANISRLGRELGLRVVAEGIETMESAVELAAAGCSIGQGYVFGRPMPAGAFATWLAGRYSVSASARRPSLGDDRRARLDQVPQNVR